MIFCTSQKLLKSEVIFNDLKSNEMIIEKLKFHTAIHLLYRSRIQLNTLQAGDCNRSNSSLLSMSLSPLKAFVDYKFRVPGAAIKTFVEEATEGFVKSHRYLHGFRKHVILTMTTFPKGGYQFVCLFVVLTPGN